MLPFQLVIYVINEMLNMIRMHSILMIVDYIYMDFKLFLLRKLLVSYLLLSYYISCLNYDFKTRLGRTGYLIGFIRTYAHR